MTENERLKRIESKLDTLSELLRPTERTTPDDCPCLSSWLHTWLDEFKAPFVSRKWLGILRSGVDNYILPNISDRPLYSVTVADMRRAVNSVPYSSMRQVVYSIFCAAFRTAHNLGYIMTDSAALLNKVTHRRQKGKALSLDVQYSFLASISGNPMRPLYLFYLLSGCRRSEALALRWTDVDTRSGRIRIRGTKTANSDRYIPLFGQTAELLATLPRSDERVFPYTSDALRWNFRKLRKAYGFTFRIHDLRHTFATRCLESGISLNTVSKWLGHYSPAFTAGAYMHVLTEFERQEVKRFNPRF